MGDMGATGLAVYSSGTPQAPIEIVGDGSPNFSGITIEANDVAVEGVNSVNAAAPGISILGSDVVVKNDTVISPRGGDGDGIRFWGSNIKILNNTIKDTRNINGAHADCMQTFAADAGETPASQHVLIDSNRCEQIDNTCLIVEGPHSSANDGSDAGQTIGIVFSRNYCDNNATESVQVDDAQNMVITDNSIMGHPDHAIALQNQSTAATVGRNKLSPAVNFEVGIDNSSLPGYRGPASGGRP
jgi:hypothetical protein